MGPDRPGAQQAHSGWPRAHNGLEKARRASWGLPASGHLGPPGPINCPGRGGAPPAPSRSGKPTVRPCEGEAGPPALDGLPGAQRTGRGTLQDPWNPPRPSTSPVLRAAPATSWEHKAVTETPGLPLGERREHPHPVVRTPRFHSTARGEGSVPGQGIGSRVPRGINKVKNMFKFDSCSYFYKIAQNILQDSGSGNPRYGKRGPLLGPRVLSASRWPLGP